MLKRCLKKLKIRCVLVSSVPKNGFVEVSNDFWLSRSITDNIFIVKCFTVYTDFVNPTRNADVERSGSRNTVECTVGR